MNKNIIEQSNKPLAIEKIKVCFTRKEIGYLENALIYICSQFNTKSDCETLKALQYSEKQILDINNLHDKIYDIERKINGCAAIWEAENK